MQIPLDTFEQFLERLLSTGVYRGTSSTDRYGFDTRRLIPSLAAGGYLEDCKSKTRNIDKTKVRGLLRLCREEQMSALNSALETAYNKTEGRKMSIIQVVKNG